jgi:hypothetical protein
LNAIAAAKSSDKFFADLHRMPRIEVRLVGCFEDLLKQEMCRPILLLLSLLFFDLSESGARYRGFPLPILYLLFEPLGFALITLLA